MPGTDKVVFTVNVVLAVFSLAVLIGYFLALTDIWHELGRPYFWAGQGSASFEWRFLSMGYWVMLAFHVMFLMSSSLKLIRRRRLAD